MEKMGYRTAGPIIAARSTGIKVLVENHVWEKINGWANAADSEVSGMFCVKTLPEGGFYAYEAFLPEQLCSRGYTKFEPEAYGRMKNYVFQKYGMEAMLDLCRGWWHTHYDFSPFWSGTDDNEAQKTMEHADGDWSVSIVVNQKNAPGGKARLSKESGAYYMCRADILKPMKITAEDLPVTIVPDAIPRRKKTNYARDIRRWVGELVYEQRKIVVPKTIEKPSILNNNGHFVSYGGKVISKETYNAIVLGFIDDCVCGDYTCIDCKEAVKFALPFME